MLYKNDNRYAARERVMDAFLKLSPIEKIKLKEAEEAIVNKQQTKALIKNLIGDYKKIGLVYKFYVKSPIFKQFCDDNEFNHLAKWRNVVKVLGYPHEEVVAFDKMKKKSIGITEQYFGAYFLGEYIAFQNGDRKIDPEIAKLCLDLACEIGIYKALTLRCEENSNLIKKTNSKTRNQDRTDALTQIWSDTQDLANLYWTAGMLESAVILLDIGNHLANEKDQGTERQAQLFQKQAAQYFLQARELSKYKERIMNESTADNGNDKSADLNKDLTYDEDMIKVILGAKGLTVFEFSSWDSAEEFFLNHVNNQIDPHQDLKLHAMQFINKNLKPDSRQRRIVTSPSQNNLL